MYWTRFISLSWDKYLGEDRFRQMFHRLKNSKNVFKNTDNDINFTLPTTLIQLNVYIYIYTLLFVWKFKNNTIMKIKIILLSCLLNVACHVFIRLAWLGNCNKNIHIFLTLKCLIEKICNNFCTFWQIILFR